MAHLVLEVRHQLFCVIQPVVRLEGKLCIFPGIPALFQKMLHQLTSFLPLPPKGERPLRIQIFTKYVLTLFCWRNLYSNFH